MTMYEQVRERKSYQNLQTSFKEGHPIRVVALKGEMYLLQT